MFLLRGECGCAPSTERRHRSDDRSAYNSGIQDHNDPNYSFTVMLARYEPEAEEILRDRGIALSEENIMSLADALCAYDRDNQHLLCEALGCDHLWTVVHRGLRIERGRAVEEWMHYCAECAEDTAEIEAAYRAEHDLPTD